MKKIKKGNGYCVVPAGPDCSRAHVDKNFAWHPASSLWCNVNGSVDLKLNLATVKQSASLLGDLFFFFLKHTHRFLNCPVFQDGKVFMTSYFGSTNLMKRQPVCAVSETLEGKRRVYFWQPWEQLSYVHIKKNEMVTWRLGVLWRMSSPLNSAEGLDVTNA